MQERSELRFFFFFFGWKAERLLLAEARQPHATQRHLSSPQEGRQSVSSSVSLHDLPRRSQLFANTCLLLGGAVSWTPAMVLGLELISGGIARERRAQLL